MSDADYREFYLVGIKFRLLINFSNIFLLASEKQYKMSGKRKNLEKLKF